MILKSIEPHKKKYAPYMGYTPQQQQPRYPYQNFHDTVPLRPRINWIGYGKQNYSQWLDSLNLHVGEYVINKTVPNFPFKDEDFFRIAYIEELHYQVKYGDPDKDGNKEPLAIEVLNCTGTRMFTKPSEWIKVKSPPVVFDL